MPLEDHLRQSATIRRLPVRQTGAGGADRTDPQPLADGVPCLVRARSAVLAALAGRRDDARAETIDARIYFGTDPLAASGGLSTRHQVEVDGAVYAVRGVVDVNSMGRLLQVDAERIR